MMKISAKWTDDCSGKKDFDGEIISISTRYWPKGYGGCFETFKHEDGCIEIRKAPATGDPAEAHSSIILRLPDGDSLTFVESDFSGDDFESVKVQVEKWAQDQMDKIIGALSALYGEPKEDV